MPNAPAENTVSTSFTLPRELLEAIEYRAKVEMTNKSELIRRALMNYLTTEERANVLKEIHDLTAASHPPQTKISYRKSKTKKTT
jgi:metal-responsive CopG/Arc/MetJ family transcriptional regulator